MTEPPLASISGPDWFARLTGVRSSRRTYYREYRHTAASLDRSIRALEPVSKALATVTGGPHRLVDAVVRTAVDIFAADWAALAVEHPAFPDGTYVAIASSSEDRITRDVAAAQLAVHPTDAHLPDGPEPGDRILRAGMVWDDHPIGWVAARMPDGRLPDDTDAAILHTLANQAVVAIQNSWLYAESERLRGEATRAYDEMARHVRDLETRNRQLREARSALAEARERQVLADERQRIARELHDTVAQRVLTIGMTIEWCRGSDDGPALRHRLTTAKELARDTVDHIRQAIFALSSMEDPRPGGLPAALRRLTTQEPLVDGPKTSLRVTGRPGELPEQVERGLYMVAREALFNVGVHAHARIASVRLAYDDRSVRLSVTDDGVGDAAALRQHLARTAGRASSGYHCGLANMASRAGEMGGELRIRRAPGGGVRVTVTVPLPLPPTKGAG